MENRILKIKGQVTLEISLIFIIIVLLLGGILKIWLWANNQIVERQLKFNASRVSAGTAVDTYQLQWPVYLPAGLGEDAVLLDNR